MTMAIRFTLNGQAREVTDVDPHTTLLQYLRESGLTGSKEGCAEGECGACAVVMLDHDLAGKAHYAPVNACLVLLPSIHGTRLWTVEGVGQADRLHPVQEALVREAGSQCGYCTPGFVISMFAHYYRAPRTEVTEALSGNLCRCTGYRPIREATRSLPQVAVDDPFLTPLAAARPVRMPFRYSAHEVAFEQPTTLAAALQLRAQRPSATVIAGGTDLTVELNQDRKRHESYLSLSHVDALRVYEASDEWLTLGAGLTWHDLAQTPAARVPMLAELIPLFASPLIRARATLGGNLVTASPVGDAAPALLALDAEVELASVRGRRRLPLADFFVGYRQTALAPDELLVAIRIPTAPLTVSRFYKVSKRQLDDISCVSAGFALSIREGIVDKARLAFGGLAATPLRVPAVEAVLESHPWDAQAVTRAQKVLSTAFSPISDARGSAAYRTMVAQTLIEKLFVETAP